jgi:signal transduction histidine kinase
MLEAFAESLIDEHVVNFLNWLPRDVEMRLLAEELAESTLRISDLVSAMKSYSFMDQANEKQAVDLHLGLDNTLTILGHKLKYRQIAIIKDYGDVPPVSAHGGELNQVWTNLLDNAIAAVPEQGGRIQIQTCYEAPTRRVQIDIIDNGAGIPPEVQARIFEPFFTTKGAGGGTGLGLDIAHRIVAGRHGGTIYASSVPGETRFQVRLPVDPDDH